MSRSPADLARAAVRHPVCATFALAFVLRALVAVGVAVVLDESLIVDDSGYSALAADAAAGDRDHWSDFDHSLYGRTSTFLFPLTVVYRLFGPNQLIGQLLVASFGAVAAALTTRVALELVPARRALVAGFFVAILPSQIFFSALTLKDAFVWSLAAGLAVVIARANRLEVEPRRLLAFGVVLGVLLLLLYRTRPHAMVVAGLAMIGAAWLGGPVRRTARVTGAVLLAVAVPWAAGGMPFGADQLRSLDEVSIYRDAQATGNTAIYDSGRGGSGDAPPSGPATSHTAAPPTVPEPEGGFAALAHLPRGLSVMLLEPFPWQPAHNAQLWLAKLEMLLWYPLLALATLGLVAAVVRRSWRPTVAFPALVGGGTLVVAALAEGNFGTAFRHRGELVWEVALLAALGLVVLPHGRERDAVERALTPPEDVAPEPRRASPIGSPSR